MIEIDKQELNAFMSLLEFAMVSGNYTFDTQILNELNMTYHSLLSKI